MEKRHAWRIAVVRWLPLILLVLGVLSARAAEPKDDKKKPPPSPQEKTLRTLLASRVPGAELDKATDEFLAAFKDANVKRYGELAQNSAGVYNAPALHQQIQGLIERFKTTGLVSNYSLFQPYLGSTSSLNASITKPVKKSGISVFHITYTKGLIDFLSKPTTVYGTLPPDLAKFLENPEELLAAVTAHEMAHAVNGDLDTVKTSSGNDSFRKRTTAVYSELDADELAVKLLEKAGYDPEAMVRLLKLLEFLESRRKDPTLKELVATFLDNHPRSEFRIAHIISLVEMIKEERTARQRLGLSGESPLPYRSGPLARAETDSASRPSLAGFEKKLDSDEYRGKSFREKLHFLEQYRILNDKRSDWRVSERIVLEYGELLSHCPDLATIDILVASLNRFETGLNSFGAESLKSTITHRQIALLESELKGPLTTETLRDWAGRLDAPVVYGVLYRRLAHASTLDEVKALFFAEMDNGHSLIARFKRRGNPEEGAYPNEFRAEIAVKVLSLSGDMGKTLDFMQANFPLKDGYRPDLTGTREIITGLLTHLLQHPEIKMDNFLTRMKNPRTNPDRIFAENFGRQENSIANAFGREWDFGEATGLTHTKRPPIPQGVPSPEVTELLRAAVDPERLSAILKWKVKTRYTLEETVSWLAQRHPEEAELWAKLRTRVTSPGVGKGARELQYNLLQIEKFLAELAPDRYPERVLLGSPSGDLTPLQSHIREAHGAISAELTKNLVNAIDNVPFGTRPLRWSVDQSTELRFLPDPNQLDILSPEDRVKVFEHLLQAKLADAAKAHGPWLQSKLARYKELVEAKVKAGIITEAMGREVMANATELAQIASDVAKGTIERLPERYFLLRRRAQIYDQGLENIGRSLSDAKELSADRFRFSKLLGQRLTEGDTSSDTRLSGQAKGRETLALFLQAQEQAMEAYVRDPQRADPKWQKEIAGLTEAILKTEGLGGINAGTDFASDSAPKLREWAALGAPLQSRFQLNTAHPLMDLWPVNLKRAATSEDPIEILKATIQAIPYGQKLEPHIAKMYYGLLARALGRVKTKAQMESFAREFGAFLESGRASGFEVPVSFAGIDSNKIPTMYEARYRESFFDTLAKKLTEHGAWEAATMGKEAFLLKMRQQSPWAPEVDRVIAEHLRSAYFAKHKNPSEAIREQEVALLQNIRSLNLRAQLYQELVDHQGEPSSGRFSRIQDQWKLGKAVKDATRVWSREFLEKLKKATLLEALDMTAVEWAKNASKKAQEQRVSEVDAMKMLERVYEAYSKTQGRFIAEVERVFREGSRHKDDFLHDFARRHPTTVEQLQRIQRHLSKNTETPIHQIQKDASDALQMYLQNLDSQERAELALYLSDSIEGLSPQLEAKLEKRYYAGQKQRRRFNTIGFPFRMDDVRTILREGHADDRTNVFRALFIGSQGISREAPAEDRLINELLFSDPNMPPYLRKLLRLYLASNNPTERSLLLSWVLANRSGKKLTGPEIVELILGKGGITGAKLAQMIASHGFNLPPEYRVVLEKFKGNAQKMAKLRFTELLRERLPSERFNEIASIDEELGSGALKVSYRVTLKDGRKIVVKLAREYVFGKAAREFEMLRFILDEIMKDPELRRENLPALEREVERIIKDELQFHNDYEKMKAHAAANEGRPLLVRFVGNRVRIQVPRPLEGWLGEGVMAEEHIDAHGFSSLPATARLGWSKEKLAKAALSELVNELLAYLNPNEQPSGLVILDIDPHEENNLAKDGGLFQRRTLIDIDFGQSRQVEPEVVRGFVKMLNHIYLGDTAETTRLARKYFNFTSEKQASRFETVLGEKMRSFRDPIEAMTKTLEQLETEGIQLRQEFLFFQKLFATALGLKQHIRDPDFLMNEIKKGILLRKLTLGNHVLQDFPGVIERERLGGFWGCLRSLRVLGRH